MRQIELVCSNGEQVDFQFTGKGYLLTVRCSELPVKRTVLDTPTVHGKVGDLLTGFIAFVENYELTLECFAYGGDTIPENYRDLDIKISI